jgi:hypothetical protein
LGEKSLLRIVGSHAALILHNAITKFAPTALVPRVTPT